MATVVEIIAEQAVLLEQLQAVGVNLRKASKERLQKKGYIQGRIQIVDELYKQFLDNDKNIRRSSPETERKDPYFSGDFFDEFSEEFFELKGKLNDALSKITGTPAPPKESINYEIASNIAAAQTDLKLPHITIPKFTGDYATWLAFHDMFTSVIDNNPRLSAVQKMHYLKISLSGEAEKLVRHLSITEDNYDIAKELLRTRYHNTRALVNNTLKNLLSQPHIQSENPNAIRQLLDRTKECLATLQSLKIKTTDWDPLINYLIIERLPRETRQIWEQGQGATTSLPEYQNLCEFLEMRFRTLEAMPNASNSRTNMKTPHKEVVLKPHAFHTAHSTCFLCKKPTHPLRQCFRFRGMNADERFKFVTAKAICLNCLGNNHNDGNCPSNNVCRVCHQRHHTLLHNNYQQNNSRGTIKGNFAPGGADQKSKNESPGPSQVKSHFARENNEVMLATVLMNTRSKTGESHIIRALVDPGSQATFITSKMANRLGLKRNHAAAHIIGIGDVLAAKSQSIVDLVIQPYQKCVPQLEIRAIVLQSLTGLLPARKISSIGWTHLKGLTLADPTFNVPGRIDLVLGADVYARILQEGVIPSISDSPTALKTSLGWILFGEYEVSPPCPSSELEPKSNVVVSYCAQVNSDCDMLRRFWELEEVDISHQISSDDLLCEQLFKQNHYRTPEGRYVVKLPFAPLEEGKTTFGDSRRMAIKRFHSLEKRLLNEPEMSKAYHDCFDEYLKEGHMEKVVEQPVVLPGDQIFYLPHHAVLKAESLTTKTRIVFDASAKSSNGYSLNDRLLPGPPLQRDIALLLFEWRQRQFVFTADIARMYRQILVDPSDRDYQRVIWHKSQDDPPEDYRLSTVTFGVSSAPFLAIRSLHQLAMDEGEKFALGANILLRDFYVDDLFSGGNTLTEAIEARRQIDSLLKRGQFELRKWASNHEEVLDDIREDQRASSPTILLNKENIIKTLGLYWAPGSDSFSYVNQPISASPPFTKRKILSAVSRIYDPLGLLSLVTLPAKILLQTLWQRGLHWDDEVPEDVSSKWIEFLHLLSEIKTVSIPRFLGTDSSSRVQIHGFCDASQRAYGAMLYLRSENNGSVYTHLISAKTKVAPLKLITLPRLELCGAVLLSRLIKKFLPSVANQNIYVYAWTDSTIVLSWLRRPPMSFKTFVSNRVAEILNNVGPIPWKHVPTSDNPADYASRGIRTNKALHDALWWHGPPWLAKPSAHWPNNHDVMAVDPSLLELKPVKAFLAKDSDPGSSQILLRFSTLGRLLRVTALCKRFINHCRNKTREGKPPLITASQLNDAKTCWMRQEQKGHFEKELKCLALGKPIPHSSKLGNLMPFVDDIGLMRVGGRLVHADLTYNERHPVILHPDSHLTYLLARNAHILCLHGGLTLTLSILRKTVWVLNARRLVKKIIGQCLPCFKNSCKVQEQLMGTLPAPRVKVSRPFTNVGVDYAGPITLRLSHSRGHRTYKGYIAIFVCLGTKAIHIEAVSDLTSNAFIAAFQRFIARRGLCCDVYSDCGTTFVGAQRKLDNDLQQAIRRANYQAAITFNIQGIRWHFIPPASPHFGGLWEAGVKSMKHHLRRIAGNVSLRFEELCTLLAQIEACLNSRPLCPLTDDPNDTRVLTPGHFLTGEALLAPPEEEISHCKVNSLSRWELVQQMKQHFWRAWSSEYLSRLQQRPKWLKVSPNVKIGDLVLLKSENLPSNQWALGRIVKVHPGRDNLVRVVTLKTQNGELKRPITKICVLPVESAQQINE